MSTTVSDTRFNVAAMLRSIWPVSTAKQVARLAGISHRTVEGWLAQRCSPSADTLLAMAEADDRLRAELISILMTKGPNPHVQPLEEVPLASNCNDGAMGGGEVRHARRLGARQG